MVYNKNIDEVQVKKETEQEKKEDEKLESKTLEIVEVNKKVKEEMGVENNPKTDKGGVNAQNIENLKNSEEEVTKKSEKPKNKDKEFEDGIEILEKFKTVEKQLVDILKEIPKEVPEDDGKTEKKNIRAYIDKVIQARKVFDEYEKLANKLTEFTNENENDEESIKISKKVIESRENEEPSKIDEKDLLKQYQLLEKQSKGFEKVEIETLGDTVVVKKKKSNAEKEL